MPTAITSSAYGTGTGTILDERVVTFRADEVFQLEPYETALLAVLQRIGTESVPHFQFGWLEKDRTQVQTAINDASPSAWSSTTVGATCTALVTDHAAFAVKDVIMNITGTAGATASGPWVARVSASTPATPSVDLVLIGDAYGGGAIDDVDNTDDDVLIKIGTAFEEFSSKPDATHIQPAEVLNYIQHFRNTWAVGDYTEQLDVYGVPELALQAEESIGKHRLDVERSSWFGLYLAENDTTVQPTYYSGGVNEYLTTNLVLYAGVLADWEYGDLVDDAGAVFQYKAGETKLMFAGTEVMNRMGNPSWQGAGDTVYTNVQNNRDLLSEIFGMRIKEIVLPNGNLRVIPHYEVFVDRIAPTTPGLISKQCYILDIRQLRAMTLRNKGIGMIEMNIQDAGQHGRMDGVYSYFGLEFKHEKRHARIQFTS